MPQKQIKIYKSPTPKELYNNQQQWDIINKMLNCKLNKFKLKELVLKSTSPNHSSKITSWNNNQLFLMYLVMLVKFQDK